MKREENEKEEPEIVPEEEAEDVGGSTSLKKLREKLKKAVSEKQEYLDGWQRARADLINFKRESEQARGDFAKFANKNLVQELIPVLDNFDAALEHIDDDGVRQIYKQFLSILKAQGVEQINPEGEKFDPVHHHSVGQVEVESKDKDDIVVEVTKKGYTLNEKTIRPASVKVGHYKG